MLNRRRSEDASWLRFVPFWREGVVLAIVGLILPGAMAAYFIGQGQWVPAALLGIPWLAFYVPLSIWYHRLGRIHYVVSIGCAVACVIVIGAASAVGTI